MSAAPTQLQPGALDVIQEEARAIAQFFGVSACDLAAQMLVTRLTERLGGQQHYITRVHRRERDAKIRARFTGNNLPELSIEFGMTVRHLRRVLAIKESGA
jgi:Mor family transcriptional regulator